MNVSLRSVFIGARLCGTISSWMGFRGLFTEVNVMDVLNRFKTLLAFSSYCSSSTEGHFLRIDHFYYHV